MKICYKMIATCFACLLIANGLVNLAYADNNSGVTTQENSFVKVRHYTTFQGERFRLLDTFQNPSSAKQNFLSKHFSVINKAKKSYSLPELTEKTATIYKTILSQEDEKNTFRTDTTESVEFLDWYENRSENDAILAELAKINKQISNGLLSKKEGIESASILLPTLPENHNDKPYYADRSPRINVSAAKKYASKYAVKPNPKYGYRKGGWWIWEHDEDCTNFASQILYAGGVAMDMYNNPSKGWWWKAQNNTSISWINANTFKNYMGSRYNTKHWKQLVNSVSDGDFIGVDYNQDGKVDHIGFVYQKGHDGLKIAQHSTNYLAWNGGWPKHDGKAIYYRVRR